MYTFVYKKGSSEVKRTRRYMLAETLSQQAERLVLLTATPHSGNPEQFTYFLRLLDEDQFVGPDRVEEFAELNQQALMPYEGSTPSPWFLRRAKEELRNFEGEKLFTQRRAITVPFELSEPELELYTAVTDYINTYLPRQSGRKKAPIALARTVLQRRLASSIRAIRRSLERRYERFSEVLREVELLPVAKREAFLRQQNLLESYDDEQETEDIDDLLSDLVAVNITAAERITELQHEVGALSRLVKQARQVESSKDERKLQALLNCLDRAEFKELADGRGKLLIFTEHKDTFDYLKEELSSNFVCVEIHGGMNAQRRKEAQEQFRTSAAAYAESYRRVRQAGGGLSADEQRQAAQDAEKLAERILASYPFHPDLLDLMYHRWGSLPSYQRTRGALQFLASVVYDLWNQGRDLQPLIGAGDIPFECDNTRNAFFTQVGQRENYTSVTDVDLTGASARAGRVDRRIASDSPALQRYRVGTRLAASAMLYSFGAREGEERGVTESDLVQAASVPGLDRMPLMTALSDLRNELLYLHYTGRRYRFETQPNLNKLIDDETKKFDGSEVSRRVQGALERALQGARGAVIWPESSGRVNDRVPMLQIVYLPLDWVTISDENQLINQLGEWLEFCGNTRREFKNALAFAIPGYTSADHAYSAARELLAIESLIRDKKRFNFNAEQLKDLEDRGRKCEDRLGRGMFGLYEKLALPVPADHPPYIWRFIELQSRGEMALHERLLGAMREGLLLFDTITPDKLIALTALSTDKMIELGRTVTGFFAYLNFTRLTSAEALAAAIARGVSEGKMGYTAVWDYDGSQFSFPNRDLIYFGRSLRTDEIDLSDALIIDAEMARELTYVAPAPVSPPMPAAGEPHIPEPSMASPSLPSAPPLQAARKRYQLVARADKGKIFKVFRAIQNLVDKSDRVTMQIEITAESDTEFDQVWLRNAVEEPLDEADVEAQTRLE